MVSRPRLLFALLAAAITGVLLFARGERRPSVLIISIDTLRADAAGERHGTPAIADFLREATHFRRARTVVPLTFPAHASLLTGHFPPRHGVHDNVAPPIVDPSARDHALLQEEFRAQGYATAAFLSRAVLGPETGLGQGFEVYDCPGVKDEHDETYLMAEERLPAALRWLEDQGGPFFAVVHLFDPHTPYHAFPGDGRRAPSQEGEPNRLLYAGEVRRVDAAIEQLLAAVDEDTIVVLVSDHGEGLGDHGEPSHGPLCYGSTLDIFLAVRAPGFARHEVDMGLRSICDVAPTLRALCGLPPAAADGRPLLGPPHDVLVSESLFTWGIHGWGQCFAATDGRFTLVESGPRLDLFDRASDPGETRCLPLTVPAYETLDRAMERYRSGGTQARVGEQIGSVAPYGQLRAAETRYLSRRENALLLDPAEHLGLWASLEMARMSVDLARARREIGILKGALEGMDRIAAVTPDSPRLHHCRALALAAMGDLTGESEWYGRAARAECEAIRRGHASAESFAWAATYSVTGRDRDALRCVIRLAVAKGGADAAALRGAAERLGLAGDPTVADSLRRLH